MLLTVDANTYSLKQILTQDRRHVVPTFQRDYEWTEDGQWDLLFTDLEDTADRLFQARQHAQSSGEPLSKADKKVPPHFLGAVVCDQLSAPAGGLDLRAVIDGQQRRGNPVPLLICQGLEGLAADLARSLAQRQLIIHADVDCDEINHVRTCLGP